MVRGFELFFMVEPCWFLVDPVWYVPSRVVQDDSGNPAHNSCHPSLPSSAPILDLEVHDLDLAIAFRKDKYTCTLHSIADYIFLDHLVPLSSIFLV